MNKKIIKAGVDEGINASWAKLVRESGYIMVRGDEDFRIQFKNIFTAGFAAGLKYATRTIAEEKAKLEDSE